MLACICLSLSKVTAQQPTDTSKVNALYDSAYFSYKIGDYGNAVKNFDRILLVKRQITNDINPKYFKIYNWLGLIYKKQGDLNRSIAFYEKAIENTSDGYFISLINTNLANIYSLRGDYAKSIFYYKNTLSILEKSNDKKNYRYIADIHHNIGFSYYKLGDYKLARDYYLKSIQLAEKNLLSGVGETYYNCGQVYQKLDSLNKADYCFRTAISCYSKDFGEKHYMTGMAYMNYAFFYSETGDCSKSERLYKKALKILVSTLGNKHSYTSLCLLNNGQIYFHTGNYEQALRYYQQSLISKIYNFNDSSIYTNPNADVLPDMDLLDILKLKAQALERLAEQEKKTENLKVALATLELATTFTERLRTGYMYEGSKLQLAEREHEVYLAVVRIANSLYEITRDYKYTEIAFKYAEYSKYAVLRELKNDEIAKGIASIPDSICEKERSLKQGIANLRMQVEDESKLEHPNRTKIDGWNEQQFILSQKLEELRQRLESNYPAYYKQKYSNQVVSIPQLQRTIDKKEAILEYVLDDKELYTFTITKDTFLLVKQGVDNSFHRSLDSLIITLHSEYSTGYFMYRNAAYTLYQKLILPVEPMIEGKNLLIIPDGRLNLIAFDALINKPYRKGDEPDFAKESYLLQKYPIGYAYSATLYNNSLNATHKNSPSFLGIAPDYSNSKDSLLDVPLGLESVKKIARLTLGKALTGSKATKNGFMKYCGGYDIIHFYTHGFEDTLNPTGSKLFLTPSLSDSTDNGYLFAWEVYNMQLKAEMVVLASCYSGSGRLSAGEGILSISRSFMYAGSQSVVMSLWAAAHKPTSNILNDFYLNLLKGMRKDEALRLAKLAYVNNDENAFVSPRFWAGIVANGNQNALYHHWILKKIIIVIAIILILTLAFWRWSTIKTLVNKTKR
ncbi:MAG: CHAT domain-containing protein [Bacteroidales bacterium]|nr:CHAT domain-containing protein [Bacteroidales bacterium]